jgi:mRNA-degrading endonuclease YafQ of YafQ-DinJ toxin-antitoxin module
VDPGWLLIHRIDHADATVTAVRTATHADLLE